MPLPTLLVEILEQILSRLPVKYLMQLKCVCKYWLLLISSNKQFSKKHLQMSIQRHHLITPTRMDYLLSSVLTMGTISPPPPVQHQDHLNGHYIYHWLVGSCDGIICIAIDNSFACLWNPSIRKIKILPDIEIPHPGEVGFTVYGFGYNHFTDTYKVVAVNFYNYFCERMLFYGTEVKVYPLGTNIWKRIDQKFPCQGHPEPFHLSGLFVNGTVNWMSFDTARHRQQIIVALHLGTETYEQVLQPDYGDADGFYKSLSVLKDCLSILTRRSSFLDIWVMREYGVKESWTKLFSVPTDDLAIATQLGKDRCLNARALYVSEDANEKVLLEVFSRLFVYNSIDGTFMAPEVEQLQDITMFERDDACLVPTVYVESLILPCD